MWSGDTTMKPKLLETEKKKNLPLFCKYPADANWNDTGQMYRTKHYQRITTQSQLTTNSIPLNALHDTAVQL